MEQISKIWKHMTSSTISEEGEGPSVSGDPVLSTQRMQITGFENREFRDQ